MKKGTNKGRAQVKRSPKPIQSLQLQVVSSEPVSTETVAEEKSSTEAEETAGDVDKITTTERAQYEKLMEELTMFKEFLPIISYPWYPMEGQYYYEGPWSFSTRYILHYWRFLVRKMINLIALKDTVKAQLQDTGDSVFWNFVVLSLEILALIRLCIVRLRVWADKVGQTPALHLDLQEQIQFQAGLNLFTMLTAYAYVEDSLLFPKDMGPFKIKKGGATVEITDHDPLRRILGDEQERVLSVKVVRLRFYFHQLFRICRYDDFFLKRALSVPFRLIFGAYVEYRFAQMYVSYMGAETIAVLGTGVGDQHNLLISEFERIFFANSWDQAIPLLVDLSLGVVGDLQDYQINPPEARLAATARQTTIAYDICQEMLFFFMIPAGRIREVYATFATKTTGPNQIKLMSNSIHNHVERMGEGRVDEAVQYYFDGLVTILRDAEAEEEAPRSDGTYPAKTLKARDVLIGSALHLEKERPAFAKLIRSAVWQKLFEPLQVFMEPEGEAESKRPAQVRVQDLSRLGGYMRIILSTRLERKSVCYDGYLFFYKHLSLFIGFYAAVERYFFRLGKFKGPTPELAELRKNITVLKILARLVMEICSNAFRSRQETVLDLVCRLIRLSFTPLHVFPCPTERWDLMVGPDPAGDDLGHRLDWIQFLCSSITRCIYNQVTDPAFKVVQSHFHTEALGLEIELQYWSDGLLLPYPVDVAPDQREDPGLLVFDIRLKGADKGRFLVSKLLAHETRMAVKETKAYKENRGDAHSVNHLMMFMSGAHRLIRHRQPGFLRIFRKKLPRLAEIVGALALGVKAAEKARVEGRSAPPRKGASSEQLRQIVFIMTKIWSLLLMEDKEAEHVKAVAEGIKGLIALGTIGSPSGGQTSSGQKPVQSRGR